ncbi:dihydropteroate synthase [Sphaerotilus sp.]|uniref:dihydropteroate synthase n=1 Tax=Sphaerotilus sp. TaxID=2093942 RepID=UPI002ACD45D6|nr:dihydropteroate synthase [Sphaerotilus sp.]MDZ7855526.1 dihydropteroate synthase [Sphaerotilus sp.]
MTLSPPTPVPTPTPTPTPVVWATTRFSLDLQTVRVMGIVNVTPDSFFDGGRAAASAAIAHCEHLLRQGADLLDIGGESSRPGAASIPWEQEWQRVEPVLLAALSMGVPLSIDTCKPEVMQRALDLGADVINDIRALGAAGALDVVVRHPRCGICLMHMSGEPKTMQLAPSHRDVVTEVRDFLSERSDLLMVHGVDRTRIVLDPGIGFGKRVEDNFALVRGQRVLLELGFPVLAGWSRKSSLGAVTGRAADDRLSASVAAALAAAHCGARVLRVHDVEATVDALKVWTAAGLL